jgi:drug/metabolite transporter (DMT)-like permease
MVFGVLILREKLSWHVVVGGTVGFLGFLVIQLAKLREVGVLSDAKTAGCLVALGAALTWGFFSAAARRWSDRYEFEPVSSMTLFIAAGVAVSAVLFAPTCRFGYIFSHWDMVVLLVVLGGASHGLVNILWLRAIKLAGAGRTAVVSYLTPVLGLAYLGVFHGQWPDWYSAFGMAMILGAIALVELRRRRAAVAAGPAPPER